MSATEVAGFTLETGSPDALCPELETARAVVGRRLGSLIVEGRRGWRARYTIGHAPDGHPRDFVRLELFNPDGGVELVRDLPMEGESCRTMAEVIALVLDRHFRGLAAQDASAESELREVESQNSAAAAIAPPVVGAASAKASQAPQGSRLALELTEELPDARVSLGVRGLFAIHRHVLLGSALASELTRHEEVLAPDVLAETFRVNARAFVAFGFGSGPFLGYVGPGFSTTLEHGATLGLQESHSRWRVLNALGLDAGFALALSRHWFFGAAAVVDWRMPWASGEFTIDGEEALSPQPVVLRASLGFGYTFLAGP